MTMTDNDDVLKPDHFALRAQLAELRQEHRDLDMAIHAIQVAGNPDTLQLQRLKRKKLALKDQISVLEDSLRPDIIA